MLPLELRKNFSESLIQFKSELNKNHRKISLAFQYLNEINSLNIHDEKIPDSDINRMLFIDNDHS